MPPVAQPPLGTSSPELYLTALAAAAFLGLAIVVALRRAQSPLAIDLGLMCVALFAYNLLEVAYSSTSVALWAWIEYGVAGLCAIPTLRLFLGYVGLLRRLRVMAAIASAYFGLIAALSVAPLFVPAWGGFPGGTIWAGAMLAGILPSFGFAAYRLWQHAQRSQPEERARTRLLGGALLLGVGGVATDLVAMAGGTTPRLAAPGLVVSAALVAALVLRARLLERVNMLTLVNAGIFGAIAVIAQLLVVTWAARSLALLAVGTFVVVLALLGALRPLLANLAEHRARTAQLAMLGRFVEQLAHDVRNPLAAIAGASQFLLEESKREGATLAEGRVYLELILERAERIERVVADYQRIGRVRAKLEESDVNELVRGVLAGARVSGGDGLVIDTDLAEELPACALDRDLMAVALENIVRNAVEAMPEGGSLTARTRVDGEAGRLCIAIRDTGKGMDARELERAFDELFTTKVGGSGLGLAFVARVMEAHGGRARLESAPGAGTTVELELPLT
jgi:two-component system, NtrC family, sensor histidine kinase HydH